MLRIICWNTQGDEWDSVYANRIRPLLATGDDLLVLVCEAGWAPWVAGPQVVVNANYPLEGNYPWQQPADRETDFVHAMRAQLEENRSMHVGWIPWSNNPVNTLVAQRDIVDSWQTNSRCSFGFAWVPAQRNPAYHLRVDVLTQTITSVARRPYVRFQLSVADTTVFTILFGHLVSGWPSSATRALVDVCNKAQQQVPQGTPFMMLGDLNVDLLDPVQLGRLMGDLPARWRVVRTSQATQSSGGELDFGLVYDGNGSRAGQVSVVWGPQWKTATNGSDHAVLEYQVQFN